MFSKIWNYTFFVASVVFVVACLWRLDAWGVQYDENWAGLCVVRFVQLLKSPVIESVSTYIMENPYVGLVPEIMTVPFFIIGKGSLFAFRFAWVFYSVFTLFFIYFCTVRWFGKTVGGVAVLLCSMDLSFIHGVRLSAFHEEVPQVFFLWLAVFCFECFKKHSRNLWLWLVFFVLGISLWAKVMVLAYILGAFVGALCFFSYTKVVVEKNFTTRRVLVCLSGFVAGALPLGIYNVISGVQTLKTLSTALWAPTHSNWSNLDFLSNLSVRLRDLVEVLSWRWIGSEFFQPWIFSPYTLFFYVGGAVAVLAGALFFRRFCFFRRKVLFLYVFYAVVFVLTAFVPDNPIPGHMLILFPFFNITSAIFMVMVPRLFSARKCMYAVCAVLFVGQVFCFASGMVKIDRSLSNAPANGDFKSVLPEIARWCDDNGISSLVCSWEYIAYSIEFFSWGKVRTISPLALEFPFEPAVFFKTPWAIEKFWEFALKEATGTYFLDFSLARKGWNCGDVLLRKSRENGGRVKLLGEFAATEPGGRYRLYYIDRSGA